jgi:hypothetical protein
MLDPVILVVSRQEVEAREISGLLDLLKTCIASTDSMRMYFEKLDISFHGYEDDTRELHDIPEVREYVQLLDDKFPYWLFFLSKRDLGLQCLMYCLMPPYLSEEGRRTILPHRLDQLLSDRWFPAMIQACQAVGFSEQRIDALTDEVVNYFIGGPIS